MDAPEVFVITLLRFVVPLLILRRPLAGIFASMMGDAVLSEFLPPEAGSHASSVWDKVLDTYYLSIAAYTSWFWVDHTARLVSLWSFAFRTVGVALFVVTGDRLLLFLVPNFFENFFIFYLAFRKATGETKLFRSDTDFLVIVVALVTPKLAQEFFLHASGRHPDDRWILDGPFGVNLVSILQWIAYLIPPVIALLWRIGGISPVIARLRGKRRPLPG